MKAEQQIITINFNSQPSRALLITNAFWRKKCHLMEIYLRDFRLNSSKDNQRTTEGQLKDNRGTTKGQPKDNRRPAEGQPKDNRRTTEGQPTLTQFSFLNFFLIF